MREQRRNGLPAVLVVEDDSEIREKLRWALASDYKVHEALDRRTALAAVKKVFPNLVLLDLGLPPHRDAAIEGLATLRDLLRAQPNAKVIVVTGNTARENARAAIDVGAYDFIEKPVDVGLLKVVLQRAAHVSALERENRQLKQGTLDPGFEGLLGVSAGMRELFDVVRRIAGSDVPVLITGESGTGKELIARAIHRRSQFKDGSFVAINCGAIPETLLESELFGYEKGAFTGADRQRQGKLEVASDGTLFLDEVGQMSLALQVKLLRFLQDGQIERVGGRTVISIHTRVVAATNDNLKDAIEKGNFREDLYYRLSGVELQSPPLRDRGEDVVLLARALVARYADNLNPRVKGCSEEALNVIRAHTWPGNVRELENRLRRAVLMAEGSRIRPADLELAEEDPGDTTRRLRIRKAEVEKDLIQQTLILQGWNVTRSAIELDITRQTLYCVMKKYGLAKPK